MNKNILARILSIFILAISIFGLSGSSKLLMASAFYPNDGFTAGTIVDNDIFLAQQQVTIDGVVNGDVFVAGNQVDINGTINGSLFVVGQNVVINGEVSGATYGAAVWLELSPEAVLQRNLYFVGMSFTAQPGAEIKRDLNTVSLDAKINGKIGRTTNALFGILQLVETIIELFGGQPLFPKELLIPISNLAYHTMGNLNYNLLSWFIPQQTAPANPIDTSQLGEWALAVVRQLGLLFLLSLLAVWLFSGPMTKSAEALRSRPVYSLLIGFLILVLLVNVFLVVGLIASLIFVLGLWIGFIGLWPFTLVFWLVSYSTLGFFLSLLWLFVSYGTKIIVAYFIGAWLFEKLIPKYAAPKILSLFVGLVIYVLLRSIPMLGWVIGVLVTAWGAGCAWSAYRSRKSQGTSPIVKEKVVETASNIVTKSRRAKVDEPKDVS